MCPVPTTSRQRGISSITSTPSHAVITSLRRCRSGGSAGPTRMGSRSRTARTPCSSSPAPSWSTWCATVTTKGGSEVAPDYPYATHLDIRYAPLEVVDIPSLVEAVRDKWYNQTLCQVNDSVVRLGVIQGEYHWHKHDDLDEFFYVLEGHFIIDLEDRSVDL